MTQTHEQLWEKCCLFIRDNITPQQYDAWFRDIHSESFDGERLVLAVPSAFFAEQLDERHQSIVRAAIKKYFGENIQLFYRYRTVNAEPSSAVSTRSTAPSPTILAQGNTQPASPFQADNNCAFDPQLNPRYTFENYCQSESNKIARSIGEAIGDDPNLKTFNPLFVFGASGVGKTHLIQAIGIRAKERNPKARVLYVTARLFQAQYTSARNNINSFFHFYQSIDTLIIDDIQDIRNMPGTQNTFFHIFNHLHQHNRQIILSSDCAPSQMEGFEERLLSRFKWGMQVELLPPDLTLRRNVLKLKADQDGITLSPEVSEYIAANVTNSVRELEGIMVSLVAHATQLNSEITLALAKKVVANAVKINPKKVNFEIIAQSVADYFKISVDLLYTKSRKRDISDARQIVMYLAKRLTDMPFTAIGNKLDRTHATVLYSCQTIENRMGIDKELSATINAITATLQPGK